MTNIKMLFLIIAINFLFQDHSYGIEKIVKIKKNIGQLQSDLNKYRKQAKSLKQKSKSLDNEVNTIAKSIKKISSSINNTKNNLANLKDDNTKLNTQRQKLQKVYVISNNYIQHLASIIINLSLLPKAAFLIKHISAKNIMYSSIIIQDNIQLLKHQITALNERINKINLMNTEIILREQEIEQKVQDLQNQKNKLANKFQNTSKLVNKTNKQIKNKSIEINKLQQNVLALKKLLKQAKERARLKSTFILNKKNKLNLPVPGKIIQKFGKKNNQFGQGVLISTPKNSPVLAPSDANIIFAGKFRGYKNLIILEYKNNYTLVLAGMSSITVINDSIVKQGDIIGLMGEQANDQKLYIELKYKDKAINPLPWFTVIK